MRYMKPARTIITAIVMILRMAMLRQLVPIIKMMRARLVMLKRVPLCVWKFLRIFSAWACDGHEERLRKRFQQCGCARSRIHTLL